MTKDELTSRLQKAYDAITSKGFLSGNGLGNELPFYVFDYPPEHEMLVRQYLLNTLVPKVEQRHDEINLLAINLFELIINYLRKEDFYEDAISLQAKEGNKPLIEALEGVLKTEIIADLIAEKSSGCNALLLYGIGNSWPLVRQHSLLSNLQAKLEALPLVVFFPGEYTDKGFNLFGEFSEDHYYRAFKLVV